MANKVLSGKRRWLLMVLGLPSLGIALAYTFVPIFRSNFLN